jgi:hypothetical protein
MKHPRAGNSLVLTCRLLIDIHFVEIMSRVPIGRFPFNELFTIDSIGRSVNRLVNDFARSINDVNFFF